MDLKIFEDGIEKTGFRLEFEISQILDQDGWNVINNKYYLDDQQERVREIDLVAYKARMDNGVIVYTVLIISCKKNDENAWVLLSKKSNHNDPNMEWSPVHAWSNDHILSHMLDEPEWKDTYLSVVGECENVVSKKPERHIFAFQEMSKKKGTSQNDKRIFESITSVMKAQAYEMNALPLRKKQPCAFQFNLLSVVQTELIRLDFDSGSAKGLEVDDEVYVAGYIIDKEQTFAKVHFIRSSAFESILDQYSSLHESNVAAFRAISKNFSTQITSNFRKLNLFQKEVAKQLTWSAVDFHKKIPNILTLLQQGVLMWNSESESIEYQVDLDPDEIEDLNDHTEMREDLSGALSKLYRYEGESCFAVNEVPF